MSDHETSPGGTKRQGSQDHHYQREKKTTTKEVAKGHVDKVVVNGPSIAHHHLMKQFWFIFLATVKRSESLSPPTSDLAHHLGG